MVKIRLAHVPSYLLILSVLFTYSFSGALVATVHAQDVTPTTTAPVLDSTTSDTPIEVTPEYKCLGPCPVTPTPTPKNYYNPTPTRPYYQAPTPTSPYAIATPTMDPCVDQPVAYQANNTYYKQQPAYQQPTSAYKQQPAYQQPTSAYKQQPAYQQPTSAYKQQPAYQQPTSTYNQQTSYMLPSKKLNRYQKPSYNAPRNNYKLPSYMLPSYKGYRLPAYQAGDNSYNTVRSYTQNPQPRSYGGFLSSLSSYSSDTYGVGANPNPGPQATYTPYTLPQNSQPVYTNPCPPAYQPQPVYQVATPTPAPYYQVVTPTANPYYQVTAPSPAPYYQPAPSPAYASTMPTQPCIDYRGATPATGPQYPYQGASFDYQQSHSHHGWTGFLGKFFRALFKPQPPYALGYDAVPPCGSTPPAAPAPLVSPSPVAVAPSVSPSPADPCTMPYSFGGSAATQGPDAASSAGTADAVYADPSTISSDSGDPTTGDTQTDSDRTGFLADFFKFIYFFLNLLLKIINGSAPC